MKRIAVTAPTGRVEDMKIGGDSGSTVFLQELQRLGFVEGKNLIIERYSAEGNFQQYPDFARTVASTQPDLIVTTGTHPLRNLRQGAGTCPAACHEPQRR
jgi:putative ABC transport system substrate-binding protein